MHYKKKDKELSISIIYEFSESETSKQLKLLPQTICLLNTLTQVAKPLKMMKEELTDIIKNNLRKVLNKKKLDQQELERL